MSEELNEIEEVEETEETEKVKTYDFPEGTVFFQEIREEDGYKWLAGVVTSPESADKYKILDNNINMSELVQKNGRLYLKDYVAPDESLEKLQLERYHLIDRQIEEYLDAKVKEHNYKSVESCVSYYNSTDDKYRAEARAVSTWRDHIYHTGEQVWQSVLNGLVDYKDVDLAYIINIAGDFSWETNV